MSYVQFNVLIAVLYLSPRVSDKNALFSVIFFGICAVIAFFTEKK